MQGQSYSKSLNTYNAFEYRVPMTIAVGQNSFLFCQGFKRINTKILHTLTDFVYLFPFASLSRHCVVDTEIVSICLSVQVSLR